MSLKNLIPSDKYEMLLLNGLPENCNKDHYPVVYLMSATSRQRWLISQINSKNHAEVYALSSTHAAGIKASMINIDALLAADSSIMPREFEGAMPMSVYEFAAHTEGYITLNYIYLCEAEASIEIERLYDGLNVSS